jgi:hypothetical protein
MSKCRQFIFRYPGSSVLTQGKKDVRPTLSKAANYWLTQSRRKGPGQFLVLDLGCTLNVEGVRLINTVNSWFKDRGTKQFRLYGTKAQDWNKADWKLMMDEQLEDPRNKEQVIQVLKMGEGVEVRYVKFEVTDFWGLGGGLQFLEVIKTSESAGNAMMELYKDFEDAIVIDDEEKDIKEIIGTAVDAANKAEQAAVEAMTAARVAIEDAKKTLNNEKAIKASDTATAAAVEAQNEADNAAIEAKKAATETTKTAAVKCAKKAIYCAKKAQIANIAAQVAAKEAADEAAKEVFHKTAGETSRVASKV